MDHRETTTQPSATGRQFWTFLGGAILLAISIGTMQALRFQPPPPPIEPPPEITYAYPELKPVEPAARMDLFQPGAALPSWAEQMVKVGEISPAQVSAAATAGLPVAVEMPLDKDGQAPLRFVFLPPGALMVGDFEKNPAVFERGFYLGLTEVTQAQYQKLVTSDELPPQDKGVRQNPFDGAINYREIFRKKDILDYRYPIVRYLEVQLSLDNQEVPIFFIRYFDAAQFARVVDARLARGKIRLPLETEWTYALYAGRTVLPEWHPEGENRLFPGMNYLEEIHSRVNEQILIGKERLALRHQDVADWPGFVTALHGGARATEPSPEKRFYDRLPQEAKEALEVLQGDKASAKKPGELQECLCNGINHLLEALDFYDEAAFRSLSIPPSERFYVFSPRVKETVWSLCRRNRFLLESTFRPYLAPTFFHQDWFLSVGPVAWFAPNPWGLYDMQGNLSEWCANAYAATLDGKTERTDVTDSLDLTLLRTVRGGSYLDYAELQGGNIRRGYSPVTRNVFTGFRLVLDPWATK